MKKDVAKTLREARARIERGWCRGVMALDGVGQEVAPDDTEAVAWCAFGAIGSFSMELSEADRVLIQAHGNESVAVWNDEPKRTKADVLELFDKAIAIAEAE